MNKNYLLILSILIFFMYPFSTSGEELVNNDLHLQLDTNEDLDNIPKLDNHGNSNEDKPHENEDNEEDSSDDIDITNSDDDSAITQDEQNENNDDGTLDWDNEEDEILEQETDIEEESQDNKDNKDIVEETETHNVNHLSGEESLQLGARDPKVIELKNNLNILGFDGIKVTDYFGEYTEKRLKEFQSYYGLPSTGVADLDTLNKIDEILNHPLQNGKSDPRLNRLKQKLNRLGYSGIAVSPVFGSYTERRVKEFQQDHGLPVSGILEEVTEQKLKDVFLATYSEGGNSTGVSGLKRNLKRLGYQGLNTSRVYGSLTRIRVSEFQSYYGLPTTGVADLDTLNKIDEILNHPLQNGKSDPRLNRLKQKLNRLGYSGIAVSPVFGSHTERRVKDFQRAHGLPVSGILEEVTEQKLKDVFLATYSEGGNHTGVSRLKRNLNHLGFKGLSTSGVYGSLTKKRVSEFQSYYGLSSTGVANLDTLNKVDEVINSPYRRGQRGPHIVALKKNLIKIGFASWKNPSENYNSNTEAAVKDFQKHFNLKVNGIADEVTLAKIEEMLSGLVITNTHYNLTIEEAVEIQMKANPQTDNRQYAWVSKDYIDKNYRVTASALNVRTQPTTANTKENRILGTLSKGTRVEVLDEKGNWYAIKYNSSGWVHAIREDVARYLDPKLYINDHKLRFQFLDLSKTSGVSVSVLNNYLKGKGTLAGQAQAFINGGKKYGVNDIYLVSHAILETGNGSSQLAKGVRVGLNKDGKPVRVTSSNKKNLTVIKTVYNMYGIGAYDSCPLDCGAQRAYIEGWTSPSKAIEGGARFIRQGFIDRGQNTIYKMRWNPDAMTSNGSYGPQYATDVGWAAKQVTTMYNLYEEIGSHVIQLDIPIYR